MAYTKIKPIKSGSHIENSLGYIQNPSKTENNFLVFSFMCNAKTAFSDFEIVRENAIKKGNNIAHHIYQSFSPEDDISPEQALAIGQELMKKMYPNHQYVIAVHTDRKHLHSHILVNSVDFLDYKKINSNKESLGKMRRISDEICEKNGLSVIEPTSRNHRENLRKNVDEAIENSNNFDEFLAFMADKKYEIKQGNELSFKNENDQRFMRLSSLGTAYTQAAIRKRFEGKTEIKNTQKQVYSDKNIRMANRKRLKLIIDNSVKKSKSFDEFLEYMRKENYEIKQGKNLAFKGKNDERFMRLSSLEKNYGDDYSEEMLRLKIQDFEEYKRIKSENEHNRIDKVVGSQSKYYSRKTAAKNISIKIKSINFLKENGIKNIDDVDRKINEIEKKNLFEVKEISKLKSEVSARFDIINSLRIYWQYKPIAEQARKISDPHKRGEYMSEHKAEMEKFKTAVEIMNKSKDKDGKLPKSDVLYKEIEQLNDKKEKIIQMNNKTKNELQKWKNAKYNLFDEDTEEKAEEQKKKKQDERHFL